VGARLGRDGGDTVADVPAAWPGHWPPTPAQLKAFEQAPVAWPKDPQGYHFGGGFLRLPARDLAKLGYL
jgi:hypothetical protein